MSREKPRLGKEFRLRRKRELLTALPRNARQSAHGVFENLQH